NRDSRPDQAEQPRPVGEAEECSLQPPSTPEPAPELLRQARERFLANWKNPTGCTPALQLIDAYDSLRPHGPAVPPNVMRWCLFRLHEAGEIGAAVPTSDTPLTASSWRIRLAEGQGSKQRGGIPIEQTIVWLKLRAGAGSGPSLAQPRPLPESIQTIA